MIRIASIVVAFLVIVGCQTNSIDNGDNTNQTTDAWKPLEMAQGYVLRDQDLITITDASGTSIADIDAPNAIALAWNAAQNQIVWIENSEEQGSTIQSFSLDTGEQNSLYWSRSQPTALSVASSGQYIAFVESNSVYIVNPQGGQVHRVAEDVEQFIWSPTVDALAFTTSESSWYASIDTDGSIAATVELADKQIYGITFTDGKTILGIVHNDEDSSLELITIDLRTVSQALVAIWADQVESVESTFAIRVNPTLQLIAVNESGASGEGVTTQFNIETGEKEIMHSNGILLDWASRRQLVIATPATGDRAGYYDIIQKDTILGDAIILFDGIEIPLFIHSTVIE